MTALSIRQPWAWLICHGYKDIENRTWSTNYRGPILVHAGQTMTRADYESCQLFMAGFTKQLIPLFGQLKRECGGIVGECTITDCVTTSESPWFVGDYGFKIEEGRPLPFRPLKGSLGFFRVTDPVPNPSPKPDHATKPQ